MFGLTLKAIFGIVITFVALVMGGSFTYGNIVKSQGPCERKFVLRNCLTIWVLLFFFLALVFFLPKPFHYIPLGLLIIIFPALIYRMSFRHQLVRDMEKRRTSGSKGEDD